MNEQLSQGINPLTLSSPGNAYCVPMGARSPSPALRPHHVCSRVLTIALWIYILSTVVLLGSSDVIN